MKIDQDSYNLGKWDARNDFLDFVGSLPMDFCNDGRYSSEEMSECLSGVIKDTHTKILTFLMGYIKD